MTVARDLMLVALEPESGKVRLGRSNADAVLGGAALIDLVRLDRLALDGEGRKAKVVVANRAPVDDGPLQAAFERIKERGHQAPKSVVTRLGRKQRSLVLQAMQDDKTLRDQDRSLWIFPLERYSVTERARRDDLVHRIRQVLLHRQPADETTGPVIGLLHASKNLRFAVSRDQLKTATQRAERIAADDWASESVRKAIEQAQAVMTTAIIAGAAGTGAGS